MLVSLLPFGAGQFQNNRLILGLLFLGAEAGSLFYWKTKTDDADATVRETNQYLAENCTSESLSEDDQAACDKFQKDRQTYVNNSRDNANYGLYGFFGIWGIGSLHALTDEPVAEEPEEVKKGSKKKPRRYRGFAGVDPYDYYDDVDEADTLPSDIRPQPALGLGLGLGFEETTGAPQAIVKAKFEF
jgi:hypothetical protein